MPMPFLTYKFCKDCKHSDGRVCMHPTSLQDQCPVTGELYFGTCREERSEPDGCGPAGVLWAPKPPSWFQRPLKKFFPYL
jgi:hypothetical protein